MRYESTLSAHLREISSSNNSRLSLFLCIFILFPFFTFYLLLRCMKSFINFTTLADICYDRVHVATQSHRSLFQFSVASCFFLMYFVFSEYFCSFGFSSFPLYTPKKHYRRLRRLSILVTQHRCGALKNEKMFLYFHVSELTIRRLKEKKMIETVRV